MALRIGRGDTKNMPFKTKMESVRKPYLIEVRDGALCDECGAEIDKNLTGSLEITLEGGYGQFFDDARVTAIFCKSCATRLINTCKGLGRAMEAQSTFNENL